MWIKEMLQMKLIELIRDNILKGKRKILEVFVAFHFLKNCLKRVTSHLIRRADPTI